MSLADQRYKYYDKWTVEELKQVNKIHRVGQLRLVDGKTRLVNGRLGQVDLRLIGESCSMLCRFSWLTRPIDGIKKTMRRIVVVPA